MEDIFKWVALKAEKILSVKVALLMGLILFLPSLYFPFFIFDDPFHIGSRSSVVSPGIQDFFKIWGESKTPLVFNFWQAISLMFGVDSAAPFRALNIFFHLSNTWLVFTSIRLFMTQIFKQHDQVKIYEAASLGAILFVIHPANIESVVWVSSLKVLLSSFFALIAFIFYLKSHNGLSRNYHNLVWCLVFVFISALSRPGTIALFLLFIYLDIYFYKQGLIPTLKMAIGQILLFILVWALQTSGAKGIGLIESSLQEGALLFLRTSSFYLERALIPTGTSFIYSDNFLLLKGKLQISSLYPVYLVIASILFLCLALLKKYRGWGHAVVAFVLIQAPYLGFVNFDFFQISSYADRYLYLGIPIVSFSLGGAYLLIGKNKLGFKILTPLLVAYFIFISTISFKMIPIWANSSDVLKNSKELAKGELGDEFHSAYITSLLVDKRYSELVDLLKTDMSFTKRVTQISRNEIFINDFKKIMPILELKDFLLGMQAYPLTLLELLYESDRILATHQLLQSLNRRIIPERYEAEMKRFEVQKKVWMARAYSVLGDMALVSPPPSGKNFDQAEEAAYQAYSRAVKLEGGINDPSRARWFLNYVEKKGIKQQKASPSK